MPPWPEGMRREARFAVRCADRLAPNSPEMNLWAYVLSLLAGFASGILAALVGVGGAVVTTPMIRWLGATPIHAVGSTVPAILPGALSGTYRYQREGLIEWRVARIIGLSGVMATVAGALVSDVVDAGWLMVLTAVVVGWVGVSLLRRPPAGDGDGGESVRRDAAPVLVSIGIAAGFMAGLLGVGGGLVLTPGLVMGVRLPIKHAVATSLAAVSMMSVTALISHVALGHVDWRFAIPLAVGVVPGAQVGARITIGASEAKMRWITGILMCALAVAYLIREVAAL